MISRLNKEGIENTVINVIGLGYVGQTLAAVLADVGYEVHGFDVNQSILDRIRKGNSPVAEPGLNSLIRKYLNKRLFVNKPGREYDNQASAVVISVGSPINKETKKSNIEIVKRAAKEVSVYLKRKQTVILRSTVPVGTTREIVKPLLEKASGLRAGEDFYLAFAPERTIEGAALKELRTLPQIVGGINEESVDKTAKIFRKVTSTIVCVSSLEAAELIKLLDNSYRDLRFAYANSIARYCEKKGLNAFEVIRAANQGYERNTIPIPSPGVGGACLSKDPYILVENAKDVGLTLVTLARKINEGIPEQIINRLNNEFSIEGKTVFVAGFAFKGKPETNDMRDSPTIDLVRHLKEKKARVVGYDPVVEKSKIRSIGVKPVECIEDGLVDADVAIFMTNHHSFFDLNTDVLFSKMKSGGIVFDGWNIFRKEDIERLGLKYRGIGIG
ncbi:MAG: nucleotide sugar dehydrogenase [Candidatus Geothermarchaeales archaeon]